jgi:antiviral helicase SKI2
MWINLVAHLQKKSLLPVVAFTFSKKRCEENASALANLDLTSGAEKSEIHVFIEKSMVRLKGELKLEQGQRRRE